MKTALIQFNATSHKQINLDRAVHFIKKAAHQKAKFILLPEIFIYRGSILSDRKMASINEPIPGPTTTVISALAKQLKVFILAGSIHEKSESSKKAYNTSVLFNENGKIIGKYRKINLFDAVIGKKMIKESSRFLKGKQLSMAHAGKFNVGMSICYDLRFPTLFRQYARQGAHILCVPSAFTEITGRVHWEVLLRARAIENLCYVLAPNQVGQDARGVMSYGHSMIINPWGEILAEASASKEEIIYANLEMKTIREKKLILPAVV